SRGSTGRGGGDDAAARYRGATPRRAPCTIGSPRCARAIRATDARDGPAGRCEHPEPILYRPLRGRAPEYPLVAVRGPRQRGDADRRSLFGRRPASYVTAVAMWE